MTRKEKAVHIFNSGNNCAQSVVGAFEDMLGEKNHTIFKLAAGFGGGIGRLQKTCGAVTGGVMVLSSLQDQTQEDSKNLLNQKIQHFTTKFKNIHGELECKALIGYDLNNEQEKQKAKEKQVFEKHCTEFIRTSVEILEEIINQS